jgi:methylenetetrahydrofolate dehydrogenase (NADP+)/methenyltetrahydrofolate cyclohydrolase
MTALIDGKAIAKAIYSEIEQDIKRLQDNHGIVPGLAAVLVGDNPASRMYVNSKAKMCGKLGMYSEVITRPAETTEEELLALIDQLNASEKIHGILVQLPLPGHINPDRIVQRTDPSKDVDGLHPYNVGLLCTGQPAFIPCTPYGICEMLVRSQVKVSGREVVIVGRSNLVGRPLSVLLSAKGPYGDATVTVCHSRSANLTAICRRADILVVAIGQRRFVTQDMVKPGAVVIDVGSHPATETDAACGDVDFQNVAPLTSQITPVPGGVGPMTIAMLMRNTANAALRKVR